MVGHTDEAHGHVRPGYSLNELNSLMKGYSAQRSQSYIRVFLMLVDIAIAGAMHYLKRGKGGSKGKVVTGDDLNKMKKLFEMYSLIYPVVAVFAFLDRLVPFLRGYMLCVEYRRTS